jgi:hypothetical protein
LGNKLGWSLKEITFSSLLEMILSVIAFILLFAIVMLLDYFKVLEFSPIQVLKINYQFIMIGIFVLVFGFLFLKTKIKKIHSIIQQLLSFKFFITIVKFIAIDFILFMIASVSVLMIITNIFNYPLESEQAWNIGISYLVAYVGGYVVFGAPGGIGVRESLFVFLTVGILGSEIPVLAVVLYRMISIFGDITGLLISISIKDKTVKNA